MRYHLLRTFDKLYILDLHGNSIKREIAPDGGKDENVFAIKEGVSINIFIKTSKESNDKLAEVWHADLYGTRESKYKALIENNIKSIAFRKLDIQKPYYFFVPKDFTSLNIYDRGFSLNELFELNSVGIVTARDSLAIQFTKEEMKGVLNDFANLETQQARIKYALGKDTRDWTVAGAQKDLKISGLDENKIQPILYRPFDKRYTYYTGNSKGFQCRARSRVMEHFVCRENLGLITVRKSGRSGSLNNTFVSQDIMEAHILNSDINYFFPLYLYSDINNTRHPNLKQGIIDKMSDVLKISFVTEKTDKKDTFAPMDMLDYIYAVLHSPKYRHQYKKFLKIDFPKIPYPKDINRFWKLIEIGSNIRKIHLLESDDLDNLKIGYPVAGSNRVGKIKYTDGKAYINDNQYFTNIPRKSWDTYVGGY